MDRQPAVFVMHSSSIRGLSSPLLKPQPVSFLTQGLWPDSASICSPELRYWKSTARTLLPIVWQAVNEHPSGTVRNFIRLQCRLVGGRETQIGSRRHSAARPETMDNARAFHRVVDFQRRCPLHSEVCCPSQRRRHSISAMILSKLMVFQLSEGSLSGIS